MSQTILYAVSYFSSGVIVGLLMASLCKKDAEENNEDDHKISINNPVNIGNVFSKGLIK